MTYPLKNFPVFFLVLFLTFTAIPIDANMAKPYVDGTESSTLFGSKNCSVIAEEIDITAISPTQIDDYFYRLKYRISYKISADQEGKLPLLFIALNLEGPASVIVNGKKIIAHKLDKENVHRFKFITPNSGNNDFYDIKFEDQTKKWSTVLQELIYFDANIVKGENTVTIEYEGHPEYNVYGLLRAYKIQYALYPSHYWKSFGPIEVNLHLPGKDEIRDVNIGQLQNLDHGNYRLVIEEISEDDLIINFSKKISFFAEVLLFLQPFGLAMIAFLIAGFLHFKWLIKRRKRYPLKYNFMVPAGIALVTLISFAAFFFSFDLIQWVVNNPGLKNGYVVLVVFIAPFFMLFYGLIAWMVDYQVKRRLKATAQINKSDRDQNREK